MTHKKRYILRRQFGFAARFTREAKLISIECCFYVVDIYAFAIFAFKRSCLMSNWTILGILEKDNPPIEHLELNY